MYEVVMPAYGTTMTEGAVETWLAQPGDRIEAGQSIAEIETDKAVMELQSPVSGVLGEHLCQQGATVQVGQPLVHIEEAGDPT